MNKAIFEWHENKNQENIKKHNISFEEAQYAFSDQFRIIAKDLEHSKSEARYFCFGKIDDEIVTVRFTYRDGKIRIIGAGYWRKGKKIYEKENKIY
ncbi:BrnT family toxin [Candidatus Margulisiibacteriota bacterium]